MNCRMFSELAGDITRNQMMDAIARKQAMAHAGECANCKQQLEIESRLTAQLSELGSESEDWTASAQVWNNVSAAFDEQTVTPAVPSRRWYYAAATIAAMLLIAITIFSINRRQRVVPDVTASIPAASQPKPAAVETLLPKDEPPKGIVATGKRQPHVNRSRRLTGFENSTAQLNQPKEVVSDFIQLTYGDAGLGGDGQIVRVELPRAAMASFGLPVNVDRADQRVKADVLLGADGLAHAIRFVQ